MQCELCIAFDERCAFEHSHFVVVVVVIVLYFGLVRLDITKKHIHFTSWTTCVRAQVSVHLEIERHVLFQNNFFFSSNPMVVQLHIYCHLAETQEYIRDFSPRTDRTWQGPKVCFIAQT